MLLLILQVDVSTNTLQGVVTAIYSVLPPATAILRTF